MKVAENHCDPTAVAELVRRGDTGALDRIAHCYLDHLRRVGRCACRTAPDAEDAVQDALLSAHEHLDRYRGEGTVEAWLSRMVVNACRMRQRGRKNDPAWNRPLDGAPEPHAEDMHECVARRALVERVAAALDDLPALDRQVFLMAEYEGHTAPAIAAHIDKTPDAVRARLTRIRRRLRAAVDRTSPSV